MLAGPSGSGKSTLLAILGCLLTPDAGHLNLAGQQPFQMSEAGRTQLRSETIGYIFQRCHLIQGLTALDNVMMTALLRGEMPKDAEALALELLSRLPDLARLGNANAVTDVGVAGLLARAAAKGALFNVDINLDSLPEGMAADLNRQSSQVSEATRIASRAVMDEVRARMNG